MGIENEKSYIGFKGRVNVIMADSDTTRLRIGVMISNRWMLEGIKHGFCSLDFTVRTVAVLLDQFPIPQPCKKMCEIREFRMSQDKLCKLIEGRFETHKWNSVIIDCIQIVTHGKEMLDRLAEIAKKYDKPIVCLSKIPSPSKHQR